MNLLFMFEFTSFLCFQMLHIIMPSENTICVPLLWLSIIDRFSDLLKVCRVFWTKLEHNIPERFWSEKASWRTGRRVQTVPTSFVFGIWIVMYFRTNLLYRVKWLHRTNIAAITGCSMFLAGRMMYVRTTDQTKDMEHPLKNK